LRGSRDESSGLFQSFRRLALAIAGLVASLLNLVSGATVATAAYPAGSTSLVRVHLIYCVDAGPKNVSVTRVDVSGPVTWSVRDVDPATFDLQVGPGYYDLDVSEGRCWTVTSVRLIVLPFKSRDVVVTLIPRPGTQLSGEFTILDTIKADRGGVAGTLPVTRVPGHQL